MVIYDTRKDHILQHIQKTFNYGNDMLQAIREMKYNNNNLGRGRPTRQLIIVPTDKDTRESLNMTLQIEQEGYDIEYKEAPNIIILAIVRLIIVKIKKSIYKK